MTAPALAASPIRQSRCPHCSAVLTRAWHARTQRGVGAGDYGVCRTCCGLLRYTEDELPERLGVSRLEELHAHAPTVYATLMAACEHVARERRHAGPLPQPPAEQTH